MKRAEKPAGPPLAEDPGLELMLLCDALDMLAGSAFLFAVCEEGPLREKLMRHVRDHLAAEERWALCEVEFSPDQPDLAGQLEAQPPNAASPAHSRPLDAGPPAVFVLTHGLAEPRDEAAVRALRALNFQRERLRQWGAPLVFWLSQNALGQLAQHAADVFAARSGLFFLQAPLREPSAPPPMHATATARLLDRFHRTLLPPEELRKQAALYERRLAQQQGEEPPPWPRIAALCRDLAAIYRELDDYERAGAFEDRAIAACQRAIAAEGVDEEEIAWLRVELGNAYRNRLRGERAENIEQAIAHYQRALEVYTRQAFPEQWALVHNNLGIAYADRLRGERAENLEQAIAHYQQALEVYTRRAFPELWAGVQNNLGLAYCERIRGERAENIEQAIAHYQRALEVYTRQAFPEQWALVHNNLGIAYADRLRGERAENLEQAIAHYQQALEVYTRQTFPEQWAGVQNNLGVAYAERLRGERAENIEQAIAHFQQALEVRTRQAFPADWATTHNNLGTAYAKRIRGERAENLEQAIAHYQRALEVYTRRAFPADWATTHNNLGNAYAKRIRGERAENLEQAIICYRAALEVLTAEAFPHHHETTARNLAQALAARRAPGRRLRGLLWRFGRALRALGRRAVGRNKQNPQDVKEP